MSRRDKVTVGAGSEPAPTSTDSRLWSIMKSNIDYDCDCDSDSDYKRKMTNK
jgi:hypothetical protein